ncbi:MAG: hypothetical protein JWO89_908 [Verrucomicrobiaceae bacterium]|nr:hypothetical protein [Verrucomicrobiaceae bacterium]
MAGTQYPIQCPACGQPFLTYVEHPQMAQSCPQCHFNGLRGQFPSVANQAPARREPKRFAPTTVSGHAPSWEVQQYTPLNRTPVPMPFQPGAAIPASPQAAPSPPGTADWAAVQAYQEMMAARQRAPVVPSSPAPPDHITSSPLRASPDWAPMKPSNLPKLTPWPGLEPAVGNDETIEQWQAGSRKRGIPWRWLLAIAVIGGLVGSLVIERKRANAVMSQLADESRAASNQQTAAPAVTLAPFPEDGTIAKAIPVEETPRECILSPAQSEGIARPLVERLFAATTDEERLACVAFPKKNADSVKDFFTRHRTVQLKALAAVSKLVRCLPSAEPQPLFDITTSLSNETSGILRLVTSNDKELKLDWPLLRDSLEGAFAAYQKRPNVVPQWISLGLRRSHGFGEAPDLRETNFFFDMQGYGNGLDKAVVQIVKNSSTGRAIDQALGWGDLFIVRVLVGWQAFNGVERLTIISAELDDSGTGS